MKKIILLFSMCSLIGCHNKIEKKFEKLEKVIWLLGNWEQILSNGTVTESWKQVNDSIYRGTTFFIKNNDTIHKENIVLTQKKETLLYTTTVDGQNNDQPVAFNLTSAVQNTFSFENLNHDYPQKIVYKKISDTHFLITISGKQLGKYSQEKYSMKKQ